MRTTMVDAQLRPVTEQDMALFEEASRSTDGTGPFQWFGYTSPMLLRERWARDGLLSPDGGVLAVEHENTCVGRVEWFLSGWGRPATSTCWSIAIGLFPEWRGQGIGARAQHRLVEYLFDHTRVERIQAWTDVRNVAERRALERCGFELEGVVRRAQWREGVWHDQALYSVLRGVDARGGR